MDRKELLILSEFRKNARENLTTTSRKTRIPISTIYDRLKKYEGNVIQRHTSLLDFAQIGYALVIHLVLKVEVNTKAEVRRFLTLHPRVNSLSGISNGYDFMAEVILKDFIEVEDFLTQLEQLGVKEHQEFYVVKDIKRETFLMNEQLI